jgi:hypothetical protein
LWDFAISVSLSPEWAMALTGPVRKFAETGAENNGIPGGYFARRDLAWRWLLLIYWCG